MAFEILLDQNPDKIYRVTLDGVDYDLRVKYLQRLTNEATGSPIRADEFTIEIGLTGEAPIIYSSLKTNRDILQPYRYREGCPQGILMLRDFTSDFSLNSGGVYAPERVGYDTLGNRFYLLYVPAN